MSFARCTPKREGRPLSSHNEVSCTPDFSYKVSPFALSHCPAPRAAGQGESAALSCPAVLAMQLSQSRNISLKELCILPIVMPNNCFLSLLSFFTGILGLSYRQAAFGSWMGPHPTGLGIPKMILTKVSLPARFVNMRLPLYCGLKQKGNLYY